MIKKIVFTITLLITISMCLMSCDKIKVENYFNIELTDDTFATHLIYGLVGNSGLKSYGILIKPKVGLDLKVNGRVIFKKIKLSYYDKYDTERFISNEGEFIIELNDSGSNRHSNSRNVDSLAEIKNKTGEQAFPNSKDFDLGRFQKIVEYDAYFDGTVEKR